MYVSVSREVKRLEGTTRSPVFALFGAALQGELRMHLKMRPHLLSLCQETLIPSAPLMAERTSVRGK